MFKWVSNRVQWFRCVLNYNNRKHIFERKIFTHYQLWYQTLGFAFVPLLYLCAGHRQLLLLYSSYIMWFAAPSITNVHCIIGFRVKTTLPCWLEHRSIHTNGRRLQTNGRRLQTLLPKMEKYCTVNAEHKEYADSLEKVKMILSGC